VSRYCPVHFVCGQMLGKELRPSDRVCERRATCPGQLVLLGLITVTMFGKVYKWYICIATGYGLDD
jgi:hypothetical protein